MDSIRSKFHFYFCHDHSQVFINHHHLDATPVIQTQYMSMLLQLDRIPRTHNALASLFTWVLLAGYLVFPSTFTSLRNSTKIKATAENSDAGEMIFHTVQNVPLLWLAAICCITGACGMGWLSWTWQENYVWLINGIFL